MESHVCREICKWLKPGYLTYKGQERAVSGIYVCTMSYTETLD